MPLYGIIGYPLKHSFSPSYFKKKFAEEKIDADYKIFEIQDISLFPALIKDNKDLVGINVTIPYKKDIIPFLDETDTNAEAIGAVNCIVIDNGRTKGYNADVTGFKKSLEPLLLPHHKNALILGTGGSSAAVAYALDLLNISYRKVSRKGSEDRLTYEQLNEEIIRQYQLIINTTPLGMFPNTTGYPPIPYKGINESHLVYDLVYNPGLTKFLSMAQEQGAVIKNGLEMLHLQAEACWEIWNNHPTV